MPASPIPCPRTGGISTPTPEELSVLMKRANTPTPLEFQSYWGQVEPEEQLTLGLRAVSSAFKRKQDYFEAELRSARQQAEEAEKQVSMLQKKNQSQDIELLETRNRLNSCKDENQSLTTTLRRLYARIAHLESIRKAVLSSIQDGSGEEEALHTIVSTDFLNPLSGSMNYTEMSQHSAGEPAEPISRFSGEMPAGELGQTSGSEKSRKVTNAFMSPSPLKRPVLTTTSSNAAKSASTDHEGNGSADGRVFFRSVRQRVEYDRFQSFIGVVRQLNAKQLTRAECLAKAKEIFGPEHMDLIEEFSRMLAKHSGVAQPDAC